MKWIHLIRFVVIIIAVRGGAAIRLSNRSRGRGRCCRSSGVSSIVVRRVKGGQET
jgi:hypothetical protein